MESCAAVFVAGTAVSAIDKLTALEDILFLSTPRRISRKASGGVLFFGVQLA